MLPAGERAWRLPSSKPGWRWLWKGFVPPSRWQCSPTAAANSCCHLPIARVALSRGAAAVGASSASSAFTHTPVPSALLPGCQELASVCQCPTWLQLPGVCTEALHALSLRQPSPAAGQPHPWGCYEEGRALRGSCSTPRGLLLHCSHLSVLSRQAQACWSHPEPQELSVLRGEQDLHSYSLPGPACSSQGFSFDLKLR